jgi:hypothetical protein
MIEHGFDIPYIPFVDDTTKLVQRLQAQIVVGWLFELC